ncbi:PLP-dependent aminotransferase family protein [Rhodovibrionaceae bacterium A322]
MTNWNPQLPDRGHRYQAIADALSQDIGKGVLAAGTRLPTHRDLAWRLGVTVGTVTRAYAEAERRGLIVGEVGRGTYVRPQGPDSPEHLDRLKGSNAMVNLAVNWPAPIDEAEAITAAIVALAQDSSAQYHLEYCHAQGRREHRQAGVAWLQHCGLTAHENEVLPINGAQNGLAVALAALAQPNDIILTEKLTFFGVKAAAKAQSLRLYGVEMDEDGLRPDALDTACRATGSKVLYCVPSFQNPTATVMSQARRQALTEVCNRQGVTIIEDDVYNIPGQTPAPLSEYLPDSAVYVTSLSKSVSPGLRVGYMKAPARNLERMASCLRAFGTMSNAFMHEVASRCIRDGSAVRLARIQAQEAKTRQALARDILPDACLRGDPGAFHLWLQLPEQWRSESFASAALRHSVGVAAAEIFAVGREPVDDAVRVCLSAARNREDLSRALLILADLLQREPDLDLPAL